MLKKSIVLSLLFCFSLNGGLFAQEEFSVHKFQNEIYGIKESLPSKFDPSGKDIIPLIPNKTKELSKTVFGYLPDWEYNNGAHQFMKYDMLTHIACFDFNVSAAGAVGNPALWPWTDVINAAHTNGVKVILTAVNFDADDIRTIITNSTVKQTFFNNLKSKIITYSLDGVNIDFEGLHSADKSSVINNFMAELTTFIHTEFPGKEVSFAGPAVNWGDNWNLAGLAASCDYIFIMGYAYHYGGSSVTGPNSPLTGGSINLTNTVNIEYAAVTQSNPEKIILGIPYYGLHWITLSPNPGASVVSFVESPRYNTTKPSSKIYGLKWSASSQTPWYAWNNGQWHQVWCDDDSSIGLKYDFAVSKNLKGVGMWALGYDSGRDELWNLIDWKFGSGKLPPPEVPFYSSVLIERDSTLRLIFEPAYRAAGYKVYQSWDGLSFVDSFSISGNDALITNLEPDSIYYFKLKAFNSDGESKTTSVLGATPSAKSSRIHIVDGFDRNSGTNNTFDYIRRYGKVLTENGYSFTSSENEAIFSGGLSLNNFDNVIWMLGDESTADETFNIFEQDSVKKFLNTGGKLFVSGSEIGWDIGRSGFSSASDIAFYENYLKAKYISDAPENKSSTYYTAEAINGGVFDGLTTFNFDDGNHGTFDVDWPDAIEPKNGSVYSLNFKNVSLSKGGAGIAYEGLFPEGNSPGKLVYLSFPFETIYPLANRISVMEKVLTFFETTVSVNQDNIIKPDEFMLFQNYPNPFNPSTRIKFSLPATGTVRLAIYSAIGELVRTFESSDLSKGIHTFYWNGKNSSGNTVSSGTYIYSMQFTDENGNQFRSSRKMILLK